MELGSILEFLENRSIIVTGATGFLAKSMLFPSKNYYNFLYEKKKIYVLSLDACENATYFYFMHVYISLPFPSEHTVLMFTCLDLVMVPVLKNKINIQGSL